MDPSGRYVLREPLARGGMGEVFRAVALGAGGFEKPVVVKRILPQLGASPAFGEMFVAEARVMSKLVHPNIVQVLDFGAGPQGDLFLVMELVDGVDLRGFCQAQVAPLALGLVAHLGVQVLRGLHHAHRTPLGEDGRGVVHRDVSLGNVLLSRVGEVKVADFGVAHIRRDDGDAATVPAGKLGYMAPEQFRGEDVDPRADLFSTGVVLYQLLTGALPFDADGGIARQQLAEAGAFVAASARRPDLPLAVDAVVSRALAPRREDRFADAREMAQALRRACEEAGVGLADADEVAESVEALVARRPAVAAPVDGRELTRVGEGRFTLALTRATASMSGSVIGGSDVGSVIGRSVVEPTRAAKPPGPVVPSLEAPEPPIELPLRRRSPWPAIALGALALVGAGVAAMRVAGSEADPPVASAAPLPPSAEAFAPPPVAPSSSLPTADTTAAPTAVAPAPIRPPAPVTTTTGKDPPSAPPPLATCTGQVLLAAKGSWWVSGGPARVQAPGQYRWPCGRYALVGTSRADGRSLSRSVVVATDGLAATRFE